MIFAAVLAGLVPSFLLVGLGGLVRRRLSENAWTGLDRLNFELLFPALLFTAAAARPMDLTRVAVIGPAVWAILTLGLIAGYAARRFGPESFLDFAGAWQTAWRFNTAMGFVAVATLSHADTAMMAVVAGMAVPLANIFAVSALSRGGNLGLWATVTRVVLNPFLLASVAGVMVGISGWIPPALLMAPLVLLAQAAIPVALLSIGATMDWRALARMDAFSGVLVGVKLVLLPAVTFAICRAVGADPALTQILTMFAALPTASAAHVLAAGFGADRMLTATVVAQSTLLAAISLPLWITAVQSAL
ncbi:AEC family transporter [Pararhodobacter zhoushanensis]|uniref:AEC family transporter n=1 Tax=Pararhodobacter zhoushanensis TaxID=2479545 RepID=A0ABT3GVM0_9RHOB|nr:AEC family transporter [Pararhodobacter zhoushanensis]MCW1931592.1 AEC family transporter [Pararhodobacter zhoushanensis]